MHDEALLQTQLPTVNTSILALCGSAVYLSDVVHQACFVASYKVTTLLTAPPVTQCLLLVDSLHPQLQLILLALLCDLHLLIHIFSCRLDPATPNAVVLYARCCGLVLKDSHVQEFARVLEEGLEPHTTDRIEQSWSEFKKAIIEAQRELPLVPEKEEREWVTERVCVKCHG